METINAADASLSSEPMQRAAAKVKYASLLKRVVANMIDGIFLGVLGAFITGISEGVEFRLGELFFSIIALFIPMLYYVRAYATTGQTVGKRLRQVRVVSIDGRQLTWWQGLLRYVGYFVSALPLGLGYLWAIGDKRKQAWHDKIAGTIVVDDQAPLLPPLLSRQEARRQQRRWLLVLGVFTVVALGVLPFLYNALFYDPIVRPAVAEARAMQPWPGSNYEATVVVPPDLSQLGVGTPRLIDAHNSNFWPAGTYLDGIVAEYSVVDQPVLWVTSYRYENSKAALADFTRIASWAEENCGQYLWGYEDALGRIQCGFSDAYHKIYLGDTWIIGVFVSDQAPAPPHQFVDEVRDAIVAHWRTLE